MTSLMNRPSLFGDLISLPEAVNSLFENSFLSPTWSGSFDQQKLMTAFNIYEDDAHYYILGMLPGLDPDKFDLNVKENVLTVSGSYSFSNWPETTSQPANGKGKDTGNEGKETGPGVRTLLKEIPQGQFYRQFQLPGTFDSEKIEAHYENGLLKLLLPKTQSSQTRRIPVKAGKQPQFMEGQLIAAGKDK